MKHLNSPLLTFILLAGFIALAFWALKKDLTEQPAYSQRERDTATEFVAFQIRQYPVAVYHPKTKREAALIAAGIWGIEVQP